MHSSQGARTRSKGDDNENHDSDIKIGGIKDSKAQLDPVLKKS